jgi:uncharacterized protein (TIGR02246 family)
MQMSAITEIQAEDAVRDLMVRLREAWERGDGEAYASLFSEEAQYVSAPGERVHGRRSIAESHQAIFDTIFKATRLGRNYPSHMRQLTADVVLVEAAGSVLFPGESEGSVPPNGLMTLVVARQGDVWRIESFQNTPTGRFRKLDFMWRYFRSRFLPFRAERSRGRR